jgi:FtsP/CotA-like multicopper oxidase with cupredoxin domain
MKIWKTKSITSILACGAWVLAAGISHGADLYVRAEKTNLTLPGGTTVEMWGFIRDTDANFATLETTAGYGFQGKALDIDQTSGGNTLNIHLNNRLDVPTSIVIPGQDGYVIVPNEHSTFVDSKGRTRARSFVKETAPNTTSVYTWNNTSVGTYLLYSGSHSAVQVQMGLYSPVTRSLTSTNPYPGFMVQGPRQVTLLFSEIDTNVHAAVSNQTYGPLTNPDGSPTGNTLSSMIRSRPQYYLINGRAYSSSTPPPDINLGGTRATQILLRMLNASSDYHVPTLNGLHVTVVAEDGKLLTTPQVEYAVVLPSLKTLDAVITAPRGRLPLYDRRLGLSNGAESPGGMLVYMNN